MLGRLATWLRVMGMDVRYVRDIDDDLLIDLALSEARIILTRDRGLINRKKLRGKVFFVHDDHLDAQLIEVTRRFKPDRALFFSRCLRCNLPLDSAAGESIRDRVPPYVLSSQHNFATCRGCARVYWPGTHSDNMRKKIERLLHGGE